MPAGHQRVGAPGEGHAFGRLQLGGGDDYELCFTAPASNALAIEQALADCEIFATVVGRITREPGLRLTTPAGEPFELGDAGFSHFEERP